MCCLTLPLEDPVPHDLLLARCLRDESGFADARLPVDDIRHALVLLQVVLEWSGRSRRKSSLDLQQQAVFCHALFTSSLLHTPAHGPNSPRKRRLQEVAANTVDAERTTSERRGQKPLTPCLSWRYHAIAIKAPPRIATGKVTTCNAGARASPVPAAPTRPSSAGITQHHGSGRKPLTGASRRSSSNTRRIATFSTTPRSSS